MMLVARLKAFDDGAESAEGEEKTDATAALLRVLLTGSIDTVNDAAAAQLISVAAAAQLAAVLEEPPPHQSTQQAPRSHALAISKALRASEAMVLRQLRDGARGLFKLPKVGGEEQSALTCRGQSAVRNARRGHFEVGGGVSKGQSSEHLAMLGLRRERRTWYYGVPR